MVMMKLSALLAGAATVSAFISAPIEAYGQRPLRSVAPASRFSCDLPPVLDPVADGLPSALELFSSEEALERQVKRHQAIVRVPSVSYDDLGAFDEDPRWKPFYELHDVLKKTYPAVHKYAKLEKINTFGLLYTIQGSDDSLKPVLLMGHQDVVPVADASTWTHPPFEAVYDGTWLWGRGASDDKNSLTAIFSALEALLSRDDWTPKRTILLAFGFDEENSGYLGAASIAQVILKRYGDDSLAIILDEGGLGIKTYGNALYVLPAVTEKGYFDIWMELDVAGGHSSKPFPHTGIGIISEIVTALEANPYKAVLTEGGPVHKHMQCQAHYSPEAFPELTRLVNNNDLEGVAQFLVKASRETQFIVQTSQSVDFISGGQKINAMPEQIKLGVNYRVSHHNSMEEVQHNVVKYIDDTVTKYGLTIKAFEGEADYASYVAKLPARPRTVSAASDVDYNGTLILRSGHKSPAAPISPTTGPIWDIFSGTIQHTFAFENGTVVPAGEIMTGNTDTKHYKGLSNHVYRFMPYRFQGEANIHTVNERVRMDAHMETVRFYYDFVRNFDASEV
ncbi:putative carboxypeptidase C24C9.08 [Cladobotryum mycophilum]|uniref:Carboxypeptidase C24C9.08 n=1 Tax=Cladobotryum mycophilum TaxID=491253 RepID=A0ABR0S8P9_9HYPO